MLLTEEVGKGSRQFVYKGITIADGDAKALKKELEEIIKKGGKDVGKYLDEYLVKKVLQNIGVDEVSFLKFSNKEIVNFEFISKTSGYVSGFISKTDIEIKSYIFYIKDESKNAAKSFFEYRQKTFDIAKANNLEVVELGGAVIVNPNVLELVKKIGFEKKIIQVPKSLGGKKMRPWKYLLNNLK